MRKLLQGFTISLIALLASLIVLEVGLRVTGSFYRKELGAAKAVAPDAFRVYCFGDSFTYGVGSETKKGYPEQLQELCERKYPGKNIKVVNFGIPGSNSKQAFNYFKHVLNSRDYAKPDAVILMTGMNDWWNIADNDAVLSGWKSHPFLGRCYGLLIHSRIFKLLATRLARHPSPTEARFDTRIAIANGDDLGTRKKLGDKYLNTVRVVFEQNIDDLIHLARGAGVEVLFSQYPKGSFFDRSLDRIAQAQNITTIGNQEVFKGLSSRDRRDEYFSASCSYSHPNAKGYALMAEEALATLERKWNWSSQF